MARTWLILVAFVSAALAAPFDNVPRQLSTVTTFTATGLITTNAHPTTVVGNLGTTTVTIHPITTTIAHPTSVSTTVVGNLGTTTVTIRPSTTTVPNSGPPSCPGSVESTTTVGFDRRQVTISSSSAIGAFSSFTLSGCPTVTATAIATATATASTVVTPHSSFTFISPPTTVAV